MNGMKRLWIRWSQTQGFHYCEIDGDTVEYRSDGQGRTYAVCVACGDKLVVISASKK